MRGELVKAVRADVLDRYHRLLSRWRKKNRKHRYYKRSAEIIQAIEGRVEYNKMYLQKGLNPQMFIDWKPEWDIKN